MKEVFVLLILFFTTVSYSQPLMGVIGSIELEDVSQGYLNSHQDVNVGLYYLHNYQKLSFSTSLVHQKVIFSIPQDYEHRLENIVFTAGFYFPVWGDISIEVGGLFLFINSSELIRKKVENQSNSYNLFLEDFNFKNYNMGLFQRLIYKPHIYKSFHMLMSWENRDYNFGNSFLNSASSLEQKYRLSNSFYFTFGLLYEL